MKESLETTVLSLGLSSILSVKEELNAFVGVIIHGVHIFYVVFLVFIFINLWTLLPQSSISENDDINNRWSAGQNEPNNNLLLRQKMAYCRTEGMYLFVLQRTWTVWIRNQVATYTTLWWGWTQLTLCAYPTRMISYAYIDLNSETFSIVRIWHKQLWRDPICFRTLQWITIVMWNRYRNTRRISDHWNIAVTSINTRTKTERFETYKIIAEELDESSKGDGMSFLWQISLRHTKLYARHCYKYVCMICMCVHILS